MVLSVLLVRRHQWYSGQCTRIGSRSVVHWALSDSVLLVLGGDHHQHRPLERPAPALNK
jgi:hypothetical protein